MESRTELAEALAQLVRAPESMLSRVFISRNGMTTRYIVKGEDGSILLVFDAIDLNGESVQEAIEAKLRSLLCGDCGVVLLDGETGLCGCCEARLVMDLLRMDKSFA